MAIKFIRQAGQTATLQASLIPQRRGTSGGGVMAAGRFSGRGFSRPSYSPGRQVRR